MNKMLLITLAMAAFIVAVLVLMKPVPETAGENGTESGGTSLAGGEPVTDTAIHYHAGFLVYVNGKPVDFSGDQYMKISPCIVEGEVGHARTPEEEQLEKAHLHGNAGDVVHVEAFGARWLDLFENIGYEFPAGIPIRGYREGQSVDAILDSPIEADESVIITAGSTDGVDLDTYVTGERIEAEGSKSEEC